MYGVNIIERYTHMQAYMFRTMTVLYSKYGQWSMQSDVSAVYTSSTRVRTGCRFQQREDTAATEHAHGSECGLRQH